MSGSGQGGSGGPSSGGSGGNGGSGGSGGSGGNNPPPRPPQLPLYGIILIVLAAIILIVVVIILIVYICRRKRLQTGDIEKNKGKKHYKKKHAATGNRHRKTKGQSKHVSAVSNGERKKNTVREEKLVNTQPQPDRRVAREETLPAARQVKKAVRAAQPAPAPSDDDYIDMTQQSAKHAKPLPTYDNKPSNPNVYSELEPGDAYEGLQSEYLQPTLQGGDMYQSLDSPDKADYVNEETGSYLELNPPGYEDPVPSAQLTAHYADLK